MSLEVPTQHSYLDTQPHTECTWTLPSGSYMTAFLHMRLDKFLCLQSLGKIGDLVALLGWRCSMQLHWKWKCPAKARTQNPLVVARDASNIGLETRKWCVLSIDGKIP